MTPLRRRMIDDMTLHGLKPKTVKAESGVSRHAALRAAPEPITMSACIDSGGLVAYFQSSSFYQPGSSSARRGESAVEVFR